MAGTDTSADLTQQLWAKERNVQVKQFTLKCPFHRRHGGHFSEAQNKKFTPPPPFKKKKKKKEKKKKTSIDTSRHYVHDLLRTQAFYFTILLTDFLQ